MVTIPEQKDNSVSFRDFYFSITRKLENGNFDYYRKSCYSFNFSKGERFTFVRRLDNFYTLKMADCPPLSLAYITQLVISFGGLFFALRIVMTLEFRKMNGSRHSFIERFM